VQKLLCIVAVLLIPTLFLLKDFVSVPARTSWAVTVSCVWMNIHVSCA